MADHPLGVHQPLPYWVIAQVIGVVLVVVGVVPAASAFVTFVKAGGTPMPIAPTQRLVVSGFNRYIRNPMYFGLVLAIIGQVLLFGSLGVLIYAAVTWVIPAAFVRWYEEPTLTRQFGAEYETYRRAVPAWWPRLRPWTPNRHDCPRHRDTTTTSERMSVSDNGTSSTCLPRSVPRSRATRSGRAPRPPS